MLNPEDLISQARDKKMENLQWIERESDLRQALGTGEPRRKIKRESKLKGAIEYVKSLILLKWPALGHK
jgi:hypothetical protein